jgi:tellurite resistance protein
MAKALSDRLLLAQTKFSGLRGGPPPISDREAFIEALILVSSADDEIVGEEMETLAEVVGHLEAFAEMTEEAIADVISRALKRVMTEGHEARAKAISDALRSAEAKKLTFRWACAIALADGDIPDSEHAALQVLQKAFGLTQAEVEAALDEAVGKDRD